jgi:hypothetical protein
VGVIEGRSIRGDVVVEGVALDDAEDEGHQGSDVLDADDISVEVEGRRGGHDESWIEPWIWVGDGLVQQGRAVAESIGPEPSWAGREQQGRSWAGPAYCSNLGRPRAVDGAGLVLQ